MSRLATSLIVSLLCGCSSSDSTGADAAVIVDAAVVDAAQQGAVAPAPDMAVADGSIAVLDATVDMTTAPDAASDAAADPLEMLCTSTGGTVTTGLCCASAGDFPSSCGIGACGCGPSSSHDVRKCDCPDGTCFDVVDGCID